MESLVVRHRPVVLTDIVGQPQVLRAVTGMLQDGKISQTYMITGPYGVGKTTIARTIARYVNCMDDRRTLSDPPCGECPACRNDLDYQELNGANHRKIDDMRNIIEASRYKPQSRYRIFVIDEAHQLTKEAVQALLKITEEPPPSTIFMLCTTDPQKFPRALSSRCLKLVLGLVPAEDIVRALQRIAGDESWGCSNELLSTIAVASNGHVRDAISTLEIVMKSSQNVDDLQAYAMEVAEDIAGQSPERAAAQYLTSMYRGKFTGALLAVQGLKPESFMDVLLQFHTQALYYRLSPKLREPMFKSWYAVLDEHFPQRHLLDHQAMIRAMDVFVDLDHKLKSYTIDPQYGLLNATLKAVEGFRSEVERGND